MTSAEVLWWKPAEINNSKSCAFIVTSLIPYSSTAFVTHQSEQLGVNVRDQKPHYQLMYQVKFTTITMAESRNKNQLLINVCTPSLVKLLPLAPPNQQLTSVGFFASFKYSCNEGVHQTVSLALIIQTLNSSTCVHTQHLCYIHIHSHSLQWTTV